MATGSFLESGGRAAILACGWLALPMLASADTPGPDPRTLGLTEGAMAYCAKADPATKAQYQERLKQLVQGASDAQLAKVRGSDEYQKARKSLEDFVSNVNERNAKLVCANGLTARGR